MKAAIVLGIGAVIGVVALLAFQNPQEAKQKVQQATKTAKVAIEETGIKVEGISHDMCTREFYKDTGCLQKHSQVECALALEAKCGK